MSKDELAQRMGKPPSTLNAIFNGSKAITPDTALQLERAIGVGAHIWTILESEYRLACGANSKLKRGTYSEPTVSFHAES